MGELVEVTLEIDTELKMQAEKVCAENGLTLEEHSFYLLKKQRVWEGSLLRMAVTRGFKKNGKVSKL